MRTPRALRSPPPSPTGNDADRFGLALLVGAAGICALVGVAAGWTLLFGPPASPWPAIAVLAVVAVGACAVVVAITGVGGHRTTVTPRVSTPPGVGYGDRRDDPEEWS